MANEFSPTQPFHGWEELYRIVEYQIVTEDGVYKKDHTPEQYNGTGVLEVEVIHAVFMVDEGGRITRMAFDIEEAKDEDDLLGGPVKLDGKEITSQSGASAVPTELTREWSVSLAASNPKLLAKGLEMVKIAGYLPASYGS
ncbi:MAG: hypothetical protein BMS9Abin11_1025 [Gammaproteobacteria bacterium]|nr:MAG: hypothetical protein BMS9Abin11_1025 [Gammaproteobacteria bacterium]